MSDVCVFVQYRMQLEHVIESDCTRRLHRSLPNITNRGTWISGIPNVRQRGGFGTLFSQHCSPKSLSIAEDSVLLPACAPCVLMDTHSPLVLRSEVAHVWDNMCCGVAKCCNLRSVFLRIFSLK